MKLTRAERSQAFAGTLKVVKRDTQPDVEAGEEIVLAETKGGKQIIERNELKRQQLLDEGKPIVVDVPKQPSLWLTLKPPRVKAGIWEVEVVIHDTRERTRILSAPPSPPAQGGLKTRWGKTVDREGLVREKKVPPKGHQVESLTDETERGYGGGGRAAVDDRPAKGDAVSAEAVDDATLNDFSRRVEEESKLRRLGKHGLAEKIRDERLIATKYRPKMKRGKRGRRR